MLQIPLPRILCERRGCKTTCYKDHCWSPPFPH
jgi:hypothetical protein